MAMAALSGFHVVINKKQHLSIGRKGSDFQESVLKGLGRGGNDGLGVHYGRQMLCKASGAMICSDSKEGTSNNGKKKKGRASSKMKGVSKGGTRGEPVMAFREHGAVCAMVSATLERVASATGGAAVLSDEMPRALVPSLERELSPAGDSASSSERSSLESQWNMFLRDCTDVGQGKFELSSFREEKRGNPSEDEGNSAVASSSSLQPGENTTVSSGRPKARSRRLDARRKRMSGTVERAPVEAFTIFPRKRADGKSDHRKVEGVQGYVSTYMREITKIDRLTSSEELMLSKIIRTGFLMKEERKKLERQLGHAVSKQQWADVLHMTVSELDAKLHEAELARDRMVMSNLRLVVSVVKQYNCEGLEVADLIQEGSIGLLKGVEKFDHTRGYKLSTYVHWWIRQGVTRAIADHSRTVRLPVHVHDALGRIRRAKARMSQDGEKATVKTLGEAVNLTMSQINTALKVPKRMKSLDKQVGMQKNFLSGDSETFHSLVADQHTENQPWTMVERAQLKGDLDKILNTHLGSREREIIKMHFGVDTPDGYPMSLESISHRYGISRERVRQLERAAKQKLQTTRNGLEKYCCPLV